MKILSMTNHRHSTPAILRNAVNLQWQELFLCVRQAYKGPYWDIKRNGKELQCLPMTLAFIKAVKTMRMSGSSSPFTSHSSSGDNTPPATLQRVTERQKGHPAHFSHWERRAGPETRLVGTQASQRLLRNRQGQAAHTMVRSFIAWKGRNVESGSEKGKEKIEELTEKDSCFPFQFLKWCGAMYLMKSLDLEARGRKQGGRDISWPGRNYFTKQCYFIAEARMGDTL